MCCYAKNCIAAVYINPVEKNQIETNKLYTCKTRKYYNCIKKHSQIINSGRNIEHLLEKSMSLLISRPEQSLLLSTLAYALEETFAKAHEGQTLLEKAAEDYIEESSRNAEHRVQEAVTACLDTIGSKQDEYRVRTSLIEREFDQRRGQMAAETATIASSLFEKEKASTQKAMELEQQLAKLKAQTASQESHLKIQLSRLQIEQEEQHRVEASQEKTYRDTLFELSESLSSKQAEIARLSCEIGKPS